MQVTTLGLLKERQSKRKLNNNIALKKITTVDVTVVIFYVILFKNGGAIWEIK